MYCGSNKTALASQKQIAEAMMRLIGEKPYSQITVSELCREAGVSRQTFYSLFTSRENVVVFTLQARYCCEAAPRRSEYTTRSDALRALCRVYSQYMLRNSALIKVLVDNHLDYLLYDSFFEALDGCGCFISSAEPCARRYAVSFYAGGVSSVARRYAQEGCATQASELEELLMRLFTGEML